jgi:hypothetical protein
MARSKKSGAARPKRPAKATTRGRKPEPPPPPGKGARNAPTSVLSSELEERTPPRAMGTRGKYVYCIIKATEVQRFGAIGLGAEPGEVYTVPYKDIAAVTSDTPTEVPDATRENVLAHERVNEAVMRSHTVIPMSFGTVFKTREDIVELLRGAYEAFTDVLAKMEDKLEYGLKLLWDRDVAVREVEKDDEEVRRLKSEISAQ